MSTGPLILPNREL
jgi:hypothetical protein